jgi:hypothetical protein
VLTTPAFARNVFLAVTAIVFALANSQKPTAKSQQPKPKAKAKAKSAFLLTSFFKRAHSN